MLHQPRFMAAQKSLLGRGSPRNGEGRGSEGAWWGISWGASCWGREGWGWGRADSRSFWLGPSRSVARKLTKASMLTAWGKDWQMMVATCTGASTCTHVAGQRRSAAMLEAWR